MANRLQLAKADARRRLHGEAAVPALYITGTGDPVPVTVRIHDKTALTGDIPGAETVELREQQTKIRFWRAEVPQPKRGATVSVAEGEAYLIGDAFPPKGETIDATVVQLSVAEAAGLPVPGA